MSVEIIYLYFFLNLPSILVCHIFCFTRKRKTYVGFTASFSVAINVIYTHYKLLGCRKTASFFELRWPVYKNLPCELKQLDSKTSKIVSKRTALGSMVNYSYECNNKVLPHIARKGFSKDTQVFRAFPYLAKRKSPLSREVQLYNSATNGKH